MEIEELINKAHANSKAAGWWHDPVTGISLIPDPASMPNAPRIQSIIEAWFPYVIATKIALIHSEVSEALEAYRTDAMDDKLPGFKGITVELADAMIRIADLIGMLQKFEGGSDYDLVEALVHKMSFNLSRPDHMLAKRREPGGKKF